MEEHAFERKMKLGKTSPVEGRVVIRVEHIYQVSTMLRS